MSSKSRYTCIPNMRNSGPMTPCTGFLPMLVFWDSFPTISLVFFFVIYFLQKFSRYFFERVQFRFPSEIFRENLERKLSHCKKSWGMECFRIPLKDSTERNHGQNSMRNSSNISCRNPRKHSGKKFRKSPEGIQKNLEGHPRTNSDRNILREVPGESSGGSSGDTLIEFPQEL